MKERRNWRASAFSFEKASSAAGVFSSLGCLKANRCWSFAVRKTRRIVPRCATRARWNILRRRRAFRISSIRSLFSTWFSNCCMVIEDVKYENIASVGGINDKNTLSMFFIYLFWNTDSHGAMQVVRDFKTKITLEYHKFCREYHFYLPLLRTHVCTSTYIKT